MKVKAKTFIGTIDVTPTWESLMPDMIAAIRESKPRAHEVEAELLRLARWVDAHVIVKPRLSKISYWRRGLSKPLAAYCGSYAVPMFKKVWHRLAWKNGTYTLAAVCGAATHGEIVSESAKTAPKAKLAKRCPKCLGAAP